MEAIRGTWSIGGIALGPIRICPRMGRTDTAGPTLSPEEELNRPLEDIYLMGYELQRNAFFTKNDTDDNTEEE